MTVISIIIPVFNAEKYLKRCVDSVIKSLRDSSGEILLIDNDSSDDSLALCREYAKKYPKIVSVLQCHTPGAAAVRNFGVSKAKGEYVWFIDADDWISDDAVTKLVTSANKTEADIEMMGAERVYPDGHRDYLSPVSPDEPDYKSRFVRYGMGPWQVMVRRKWWLDNGFAFKEGFIHEDMEMMSALILYTDKLASVNEPLYFYSQNDESVLHQKKFNSHIFDIFPALEGLYQRFTEAGAEQKYHDELEWFFIWNLLIDSAKDFGQFPEGHPGFQRSREMLKKYFPEWRKNRFLREKPLKLQIRVRLNYKK
ncbi:MAG: glycosyltransferase family A protein [Candidatus Saccharibacteria bacterium]|nr:glycosyltransferase family A protein [Candidatus Saccharibacteria bacterium]